jgi:hypothetical protein
MRVPSAFATDCDCGDSSEYENDPSRLIAGGDVSVSGATPLALAVDIDIDVADTPPSPSLSPSMSLSTTASTARPSERPSVRRTSFGDSMAIAGAPAPRTGVDAADALACGMSFVMAACTVARSS